MDPNHSSNRTKALGEAAQHYITLSDSKLLEELGLIVIDDRLDIGDFDSLKQQGEQWLKENTTKIREIVCNSVELRELTVGKSGNLIQALAAAIGAHFGVKESAILAILIVRGGIASFCGWPTTIS